MRIGSRANKMGGQNHEVEVTKDDAATTQTENATTETVQSEVNPTETVEATIETTEEVTETQDAPNPDSGE